MFLWGWAVGWALGATAASAPPSTRAVVDSLQRCEGIMAHRVVHDSTRFELEQGMLPERIVRSSAVEGELKDRWLALLTSDGLRAGVDCEPVCLTCQDRVRYRFFFPPLGESFFASLLWDDRRLDFVSEGRVIAYRLLGASDSAWVDLLKATFPTDSASQALVARDPPPRGKRPRTPRPNEFVFAENPPEPLGAWSAEYPEAQRAEGREGHVIVMSLVGVNGRVVEAFAREPVPGFDEAAVSAVRKWLFKAARCGGKRVATWVAVPVRFSLR